MLFALSVALCIRSHSRKRIEAQYGRTCVRLFQSNAQQGTVSRVLSLQLEPDGEEKAAQVLTAGAEPNMQAERLSGLKVA